MIVVEENIDIKPFTTFGISAHCKYFCSINSIQELEELRHSDLFKNNKKLFLGGGSNMLFLSDFEGLIIKLNIKGIEVVKEDASNIWIKASAGVVWDDLVRFCVENNWGGLENLAYIPGNVGSCPVQNIGAYGAEISQTCEYVETFNIETGEIEQISNADCKFGYRSSIFKLENPKTHIITAVVFKLSLHPTINASYSDINKYFDEKKIPNPSITDVYHAVTAIRKVKLPDPEVFGNAGSFFKNPCIEIEKYNQLKLQYPNIVAYPADNNTMKLAAGWLIDSCNLKGYRRGDAGVHANQALVIVNHGNASGQEIADLARYVQQQVEEKFGVRLEFEVNFIS